MQLLKEMFEGLTLDDIREWAGGTIYSRGKRYIDLVSQLSRTEEGAVAAWVSGSDDYAVSVMYKSGKFINHCTCPYDRGPCKHAVAVLLAAQEQIGEGVKLPLIDPEDELLLELQEDGYGGDDPQGFTQACSSGEAAEVESLLSGKTREELLALTMELAYTIPAVADRIRVAAQIESGQITELVRSLRLEIRSVTAEEAWYNPWKGEGNLPDYSHIEQQLRTMVESGYADEVLRLGEELWQLGLEQIDQSHDEGETMAALADCMTIVLEALPDTSLTPVEQLLWLIERELEDDFSVLDESLGILYDPYYKKEHWREVAKVLEGRLKGSARAKGGSSYYRGQMTDWLCEAYRCSDQEAKVVALLEEEADRTQGYEKLVRALLESGMRERARSWCIRGFAKTVQKAPGLAANLQQKLLQLAEEEGKKELVAAYRAENFFARPSLRTFTELHKAAERIKSWPAVRSRVLEYLRTGRRFMPENETMDSWPLPPAEVAWPNSRGASGHRGIPQLSLLIEIAILEKRNDDAVELHGQLAGTNGTSWGIDEKLAQAVKKSHPNVALRIWLSIAERLIAQVKPQAYQQASTYLRYMRKLYEDIGSMETWHGVIATMRTKHKAKRRLMEVLDGLERGSG